MNAWGIAAKITTRGKWCEEILNLLRYRSYGWWSSNRREKGANHGVPTHTRSGPRKRWELGMSKFMLAFNGVHWIDESIDPGFSHRICSHYQSANSY